MFLTKYVPTLNRRSKPTNSYLSHQLKTDLPLGSQTT